jgi:nucleotide-binding universal stress UspA family protein
MRHSAPIVCGVDHSIAACAAARLSAALARRLGLPLVLVHAASAAAGCDAARSRLTTLRNRLDAQDAIVHVDVGPASDVLVDAAEHATLLCLGGPGERARCRVLGGRTRIALARRAPCPQLVVPPVHQLGGAEIVCGIRDWADVSTAQVAVSLARALRLDLTLTHVVSAASPGVGPIDPPWDDDAARRLLDAVAAAVGVTPATRVRYGPPGQTLEREASEREAAILVIGAPVYGRVGSALAGSASTHLLHRTRRPLAVCPRVQSLSYQPPSWPPIPAGSARASLAATGSRLPGGLGIHPNRAR